MKSYIDLGLSILMFATFAWGLYYGIASFGLKRERSTFLGLTLAAKPICILRDLVLVSITVHVENKGNGRIDARRSSTSDGYLYNDGLDICRHAGTLKLRSVSAQKKPVLFDWYSLPPIQVTTRVVPHDKLVISESDLEQVNYLDEFQDPEVNYDEVDFWLEPHESYEQAVFVWLRPGIYAAKAFFLGKLIKHREEEYWSSQILFSVAKS